MKSMKPQIQNYSHISYNTGTVGGIRMYKAG